jgi:hypothetical protein
MSIEIPVSIFESSCANIAFSFAATFSATVIGEVTVIRNGEDGPTGIRQLFAEAAYLGMLPCCVLETLARAVLVVVFIPVLGIPYFIGRFCCCNTLKNLSEEGIRILLGSVVLTGVAVADTALCLWNNPCDADRIPLHVRNKLMAAAK